MKGWKKKNPGNAHVSHPAAESPFGELGFVEGRGLADKLPEETGGDTFFNRKTASTERRRSESGKKDWRFGEGRYVYQKNISTKKKNNTSWGEPGCSWEQSADEKMTILK